MLFAVIGNGFVGGATQMFACDANECIVYDKVPALCRPVGVTLADVAAADLIFVCVPTPMNADGSCNTSVVDRVVQGVRAIRSDANVVIRSTVPPGTSATLACKFMPEFLTERNWRVDMETCPLWVFGTPDGGDDRVFARFLDNAFEAGKVQSSRLRFVATTAAELIKYSRNCFLATKVSFFNEVFDVCAALGVEYAQVRDGVAADPRIGASHTQVPGPDAHRGFGGTCLVKDTNALRSFAEKLGMRPYILPAVIRRNEERDRPEQDWKLDARAYSAA